MGGGATASGGRNAAGSAFAPSVGMLSTDGFAGGVGGLAPYWMLVLAMDAKQRGPILIPLFPACSLATLPYLIHRPRVPTPSQLADAVRSMLAACGAPRAAVLAHSYGTAMAGALLKQAPALACESTGRPARKVDRENDRPRFCRGEVVDSACDALVVAARHAQDALHYARSDAGCQPASDAFADHGVQLTLVPPGRGRAARRFAASASEMSCSAESSPVKNVRTPRGVSIRCLIPR